MVWQQVAYEILARIFTELVVIDKRTQLENIVKCFCRRPIIPLLCIIYLSIQPLSGRQCI